MLPTRTFIIPPILITGSGSSEKVGEESRKLGVKKGLIVTDEVLSKMEIVEGVKKALTENKIEFAVYDKAGY
jgi:alcohol dehydrogenase class IV